MSRERVQAEGRMIGALLARPDAWRALAATPIGADHFREAEYRRAFMAAAALAEDGYEVNAEKVAARAGLSGAWRDSLAKAASEDNGASVEQLASDLADLALAEAEGEDRPGLDLGKCWVTFSAAQLGVDPPEKGFVWADRIPLGDVGVFAAQGGAGKTALLTGLAIHRAIGAPFLGRAVRQGTTVIVTAEDGAEDYLRKIAAWRTWLPNLDLRAVARHVHLVDLTGEPFKLITSKYGEYVSTAHVEMLADAIRARAPDADLIVIETVSRVGGDESNPALSALVCAAEQLAALTGASVLLVAHVSQDAARQNVGDAHAPRGGTAIGANGRYTITLAGVTKEILAELLPGVVLSPQQQAELSIFRVPKINAAPRPDPVVLQIVPTRWGLVLREYEAPTAGNQEEIRRAARRAMSEQLRTMAQRYSDLGERFTETTLTGGVHKDIAGLSKQRVPASVADAIEDGFLHRGPSGRGGGKGCLLPGPGDNSPAATALPGQFAGESGDGASQLPPKLLSSP